MKRLLAVQHTYSEFFGALEPQWEAREIGFTYIRTVAGQDVAGTPSQFDALWLLGAAHPVADRGRCPWVDDEIRLVRAFERARRPVVGLGDGALVLAAAHGATLHAEPQHDARFAQASALVGDDPVARAVDGRRVLVISHGRAELPAGSQTGLHPTVADQEGRWIAFRAGQFSYGLLFRPELNTGMLEDMVMEEGRDVPDNIAELIAEARERWGESQVLAARVFAALASELGLMQERAEPTFIPVRAV